MGMVSKTANELRMGYLLYCESQEDFSDLMTAMTDDAKDGLFSGTYNIPLAQNLSLYEKTLSYLGYTFVRGNDVADNAVYTISWT